MSLKSTCISIYFPKGKKYWMYLIFRQRPQTNKRCQNLLTAKLTCAGDGDGFWFQVSLDHMGVCYSKRTKQFAVKVFQREGVGFHWLLNTHTLKDEGVFTYWPGNGLQCELKTLAGTKTDGQTAEKTASIHAFACCQIYRTKDAS